MTNENTLSQLQKKTHFKIMVLLILFALVIASFLISIRFGAHRVSVNQIFRALLIDREGLTYNIIWKIRVPRSLVAAMVGVCLALSGGILQGVMRNPLASPNIIGVSSGAGLAAAITLVLLPNYSFLLTPMAFVGAFLTTIFIYTLSWKDGINPLRMILSGIAISSFMSAIVNTILIFHPDRVHNTLGFTIGSLSAKTWVHYRMLWPYALVGFFLAIIMSKKLNILMLGDEIASSLGLHVESTRVVMIMIASLLAASSVSVVGMLGFVGLIVPHMMRIIIGSDYRFLFPASALFGASLMMVCDTIARMVMDPMEIPVGIIMALLGAPFFLYLLRGGKMYRAGS